MLMFIVLQFTLGALSSVSAQNCSHTPTPANCTANEVRCDSGSTAGCWMGDYCMPEGSICPMACNTPGPAQCADDAVICDNGSYGGCWMGNYCMDPGYVCPPVCNSPAPSHCAAGEVACDNGSTAGCWNGDHCMPEGVPVQWYVIPLLLLNAKKMKLDVTVDLQQD